MIGYACQLLEPPGPDGMDLIYIDPLDAKPMDPEKWPFKANLVPAYKNIPADATPGAIAQTIGHRQIQRMLAITEYYELGSKLCPHLIKAGGEPRGEGETWWRQIPSEGDAAHEKDWQHDICQLSYNKLSPTDKEAWRPVRPKQNKARRGMAVPSVALMQLGIGVLEEDIVTLFEAGGDGGCLSPTSEAQTKLEAMSGSDKVSPQQLRAWQLKFIQFAKEFKAVVACRLQPMQKKELVHLLKTECGQITLAIGDGNNDVAMIKEAHVGVGIAGVEGTQAVSNADFSINQFKLLLQLMMVHGRWAYMRLGLIVTYFFDKNVVFSYAMISNAFVTGFSAVSMYDDWVLTL